MYQAAGAYLGKLARLGLVEMQFKPMGRGRDGWVLTDEGRQALHEAETSISTRQNGGG